MSIRISQAQALYDFKDKLSVLAGHGRLELYAGFGGDTPQPEIGKDPIWIFLSMEPDQEEIPLRDCRKLLAAFVALETISKEVHGTASEFHSNLIHCEREIGSAMLAEKPLRIE